MADGTASGSQGGSVRAWGGKRRLRWPVAAVATAILALVVGVFLFGPTPSAQAADVRVGGLTIELSNPPYYGAYPRHGWRYVVNVTELSVNADKAVGKIVRAYANNGLWSYGSGTLPPQNGRAGALEATFPSPQMDQQNHLGEWFTWYFNGTTALHGYMYVDENPHTWSPDPFLGWRTWNAGVWRIYYTDGTTDEVRDYTSLLGMPPGCNTEGDPVNTSTGNATYQIVDLSLPGLGPDLMFARSYNSRSAADDGPLGFGWTHSYSVKLRLLSSSVVGLLYPDGHQATFQKQSDSSYAQPSQTREKLVKNGDGTYTVTCASQALYQFSSTGRLESISDRYGNVTTLTYNVGGQLVEVEEAAGRSLSFTYTGSYITSVTDSASRSVSYGYDANGNLTSVTDANGHISTMAYDSLHQITSLRQPEASANPFTTNTYSGQRVVTQVDALGNQTQFSYNSTLGETEVTDARNNTSADTWDLSTLLVAKHTDANSDFSTYLNDWRGRLQLATDANGNRTGYAYDSNGNPSSVVDAGAHASRAGYDQKNNLLWVQEAAADRLTRSSSGLLVRDDFDSDSLGNYTTAAQTGSPSWSISGGLLSQTTATAVGSLTRDGVSTAKCATARVLVGTDSSAPYLLVGTGAREGSGLGFPGYQAQLLRGGNPWLYKRASGTQTPLQYGSYNVTAGLSYFVRAYVDSGSVVMKAGSTDLSNMSVTTAEATYTQGSGGLLASSTNAFDYLELRTSQWITVTGLPAGYKARAVAGTRSAQATASSGSAVVDAGGLVFPLDKMEVLDAGNNVMAELTLADMDDMGGGDVFTYDGTVDHRTTYAYDQTCTYLDSVQTPIGETSFTWNTDGTLDTLTDAESHTWSYDYNAYGDLTSVTDPLYFATTYGYDAAGRVTSTEDANSSLTQFTYDAKGNVTSVKDPLAEADPLNRHQIDVTYDDNDNVTEIEDARGNSTLFTYDDMNHLTLVEDALSGEANYGYDENYNLTSAEDPNGHTTAYAYDANDRLSSVTDPLSQVTEYEYDPVGNLTGITFPNDDETSYTYTDDNLLSGISHSGDSVTYTYSYNPTHTVSQVERNDGKTWAYTYDNGNRLTSESDENNATLGPLAIERSYDDVSNLTGLEIGSLVTLALTYDARNLVSTLTGPGGTTEFTHDNGGRVTEIATPEGSTRSITYDPASRPTEVENVTDSGTQTLTYTYDANGNVLTENGTTYGYDALNRLTSWYDPVLDETTSYLYDAGGNLTQVQVDSVTTESYTLNAGDQITNAGYVYDDNGNLTSDGVRTFTYDCENQLIQVSEGQTVLASMTYDFAGRRTSLTTAAGTTYFHYLGGLLIAESDGNGLITATYAYDDLGSLVSMTRGEETYYYQTNGLGDVISLTDDTGAVVATYRYDPWGKPLATTGTIKNPFRYAGYYYDEATGLYYLWNRYYDPDTKRFLTVDPAILLENSRYGYAFDCPTGFADPTGLGPQRRAVDPYDWLGSSMPASPDGGPAGRAATVLGYNLRAIQWKAQTCPSDVGYTQVPGGGFDPALDPFGGMKRCPIDWQNVGWRDVGAFGIRVVAWSIQSGGWAVAAELPYVTVASVAASSGLQYLATRVDGDELSEGEILGTTLSDAAHLYVLAAGLPPLGLAQEAVIVVLQLVPALK